MLTSKYHACCLLQACESFMVQFMATEDASQSSKACQLYPVEIKVEDEEPLCSTSSVQVVLMLTANCGCGECLFAEWLAEFGCVELSHHT